MTSAIDFCLHEIVRVRVLGGSSADVAAVRRQLGPIDGPVHGDADLVIRFVDRLTPPPDLCLLGDREAGFDQHAFWVLRGKFKMPVRVQLPLDSLGLGGEIICQRGISAVPLLIAAVNLTALAKGYLPLHASAFLYEDAPVLVMGWSKGGKTESVLGFAEQGATYIGDEWVYLQGDGQRMWGIPEPIRIWDWHLRDCPTYWPCLTRKQRMRLRLLRWLVRACRWCSDEQSGSSLSRLGEFLHRQQHVQVPPRKLFADRIQTTAEAPVGLFFVAGQEAPETEVRSMPAEEIAARMRFSLEEEFSILMSWYCKFRFAFPERCNPLLEGLPELLDERLQRAFQDRPGLAVLHPHPANPRDLFAAMQPHIRRLKAIAERDASPVVGPEVPIAIGDHAR